MEKFINENKETATSYFDVDGILALTEEYNENVIQDTLQKLDFLKNSLSSDFDVDLKLSNVFTDHNHQIDIGFNLSENSNDPMFILMGFFEDDKEDEYNEVLFKLKLEIKDGFSDSKLETVNEMYSVNILEKDFPATWEELINRLKTPFQEFIETLRKNTSPLMATNTKYIAPLNQILYGPPGTGKTYNTIIKAISIANPDFDLDQERELIKTEYNRLAEAGQIVFTTFHQSMSYEDFIEGIKPVMNEDEGELSYEVQNGIFKELCENADKIEQATVVDHFDESWDRLIELVKVKISEEKLLKIGSWEYGLSSKESLKYSSLNSPSQYTFTITRQNIQDTYQNKQARPSGAFQKDMEDIVQFMKENFDLPDYELEEKYVRQQQKKNFVLIIDEINRGNISQIFGELITLIEESKRLGRSEELHVTLPYSKSKFGVPSNLYIIGTMNTADRSVEALDTALRRRFSFVEMMPDLDVLKDKSVNGIVLRDLLQTVNRRVEVLLGRDHTIGHSYFVNVEDEHDLRSTFKNNIIPLLQEYFYGDYDKIGMILGNGFFDAAEKYDQSLFADFTVQNRPEPGTFKRLRSIDDNFPITEALNVLMKKPLSANA